MGLAEIDAHLGVAPQGGGLAAIDAELAKPSVKPGPSSPAGDGRGIVSGAILDTLGVSERSGAVPLTGNAETKTPLGVVLQPKNGLEFAAREAVMAPLTAGSLPVRLGVSGAQGALDALMSGRGLSGAGYEAALDVIVAGVSEAVLGKAGKKLAEYAAPARMFQYATEAPMKALDALRARLPKGKWMNVPSIAGTKITADEAVQELTKLTGNEYKQARAEIANELSRLDAQRITGPRPVAGTVFNQRTSPERFEPPNRPLAQGFDAAARALRAPVTRAAADVAATTPIDNSGTPVGVVPIAGAWDHAGSLLRRIANTVIH